MARPIEEFPITNTNIKQNKSCIQICQIKPKTSLEERPSNRVCRLSSVPPFQLNYKFNHPQFRSCNTPQCIFSGSEETRDYCEHTVS